MRRHLAVATAALVIAGGGTALAQEQEGFALNRFNPSERGSDWFSTESLNFEGQAQPILGGVFDWAHEPLVLYDEDGNKVEALVKDQLYFHLGGGVVLWDRLRFAASFPILLAQGTEEGEAGAFEVRPDSGAAAGDLRLGADVLAVGEADGVFRAGLGVQVHLPTGNQDAFASDGSARVEPRALLAGDAGPFTWAGRVGANIRTLGDSFAGSEFGSELTLGLAAGGRLLDDRLLLGPELYTSTVVSDGGDGFFKRTTTPLEVIAGAHFEFADDWHVGAGFGPGLTRGLGTPTMRVVASIEWVPKADEPPPPPPPDSDGDGIVDAEDACVNEPGVATNDPQTNGCPPPADSDGDGIVDAEDACVNEPGIATNDPQTNGCPPPADADGDGIVDAEDACPDQAGEPNEDPSKHGCPPPPDTDGDGILDADDACVDVPGEPSEDPKKNGCPVVKVTEERIEILERIEFEFGKAQLRPESEKVLNAVLQVLQKHEDITKVNVEGHTDSRGAAWINRRLSQQRAEAVVAWLVERGVAEERLSAKGLGPDQPIATNDTEEGRQTNRRVEFKIVERAKPVGKP